MAVGTEVIGTVEVAVETAEGLIMLVVDGEVGSVQLRIYGRSMQKKWKEQKCISGNYHVKCDKVWQLSDSCHSYLHLPV